MASATSTISLKIEFSGGLELLFSNQRSYRLAIPAVVSSDNTTSPLSGSDTSPESTKPADVAYLIHHLRDHLLKERAELFMEKGTV